MLDVQKAETYLGGFIVDPDIYIVRDVAPNKVIMIFFYKMDSVFYLSSVIFFWNFDSLLWSTEFEKGYTATALLATHIIPTSNLCFTCFCE